MPAHRAIATVATPASTAPVPASIDEILEEMRSISDFANERTLTDVEAGRYEALEEAAVAARRSENIRRRQEAYETPVPGDLAIANQASAGPPPNRNPLAYTPAALDTIQDMIERARTGRELTTRRVSHDLMNAALTTGTYGAPREWGSNVLDGPRLLHVIGGVPRQPVDAILAQFPQLTLPTPVAASGEGATLTEYASSAAGSVTLGRFGRFTDLTYEAMVGASSDALVAMHALGIALDLDNVLIGLVNTAAGAAVGFTADVPAAIRKAMALVLANTATSNPTDLVILAHPNNIALLQSVTPTGGQTIAEAFQNFSGALVYPSNAVPTDFMIVANLKIGVRYFEATGVVTLADTNIKTNVDTISTLLVGGYGISLVAGFASKIDVVTP